MTNQAALEIIEAAKGMLERAQAMIDNDEKIYVYGYRVDTCPDALLEKWLKAHGQGLVNVCGIVQVEHELEKRKALKIKIVEVK